MCSSVTVLLQGTKVSLRRRHRHRAVFDQATTLNFAVFAVLVFAHVVALVGPNPAAPDDLPRLFCSCPITAMPASGGNPLGLAAEQH